jgi:MarR family transcriptional regulator, transcriptional regulator for hemolysin
MTPLSPAKNLGLLVHDVSRLLRRRLDQEAQSIGLTSAQWRVLAYLARCEGINQASLADVMDMEPITLSRHLDRMQAAGLTERRPDPTDRRAHQLYLTEAALPLITAFRTVAAAVMQEAVEGISEKEIDKLSESLFHIRNNLTGKTGERSADNFFLPAKQAAVS